MDVTTFEAEFWRWFLKEHFIDFQNLSTHQQILNNQKNIFVESTRFDLSIDLNKGICIDSQGHRWPIVEYIAQKNGNTLDATEMRLEVEHTRWEEQQKARQRSLHYIRDAENYCWKKRTGEDSFEEVTDFDIILNSVIEKYNLKQQEWERYYEATLRYERLGREKTKEIKLDPADVHSKEDFSKAVWEKDVLRVKNMRRGDMRDFWFHVNVHFEPRIVREYNHFGFIYFDDRKYFLADNVLIKFPDQYNKPLQLIAKEEGAFPVEDNKYVKPPEDAVHLPHFELGVPQNGQYKKAMGKLLSDEAFERQLAKVEDHFCSMVGGNSEFRQWGKLLIAYAFSYLFFEDIYGHFKHVIFLYLYGEGNVGKGEVAKLIQDFYGINHLDSLNTPTARPVDNALELKSEIPQWIDEHVPEVPGKDAKIKDQVWNSWFELKPRPTSMQKNGTWATERKEVRTMPLFCSNFKPKTDHLLSRCIILEYRKQVRGPEKHVNWLKRERDLLQLLMLSFMQHYHLIDRQALIWDIDRIRTKLKNEVKKELEERNGNAVLQDRQISQFAILISVHQWLQKDYRTEITSIARQSEALAKEPDETYRQIQQEQIETDLADLIDESLYQFVKAEIIKSAVIAAHNDPLTNYLETIGTLIQAGKITPYHFNWTKEGHLKIWAKAIWDEYISAKRGTDDIVRRETVENKLKQMSELSSDGSLKTVNWTPQDAMKTIRQKGFYIKNAAKKEIFRNAFHFENYGPDASQLPNITFSEQEEDNPETLGDTSGNSTDEIPF
jgi:hypothetical protein